MTLGKKEKEYLLKLARQAVELYLKEGRALELRPADVPHKKLVANGACFVSLHCNGQLRGCIGSLEAHRPLVFDVIANALCAAFEDPRFIPLCDGDLCNVKFSISVLTAPKPLPVKDAGDLLRKLTPHRHGLTIRKGYACATFLPVVWEQLGEKEEFLAHLCMKAGLEPDSWKKTDGTQFYTYEAEEFSE
ncbi:MAG: AmmeMemoRadiSam system protein A [Candidatus ainarchaeum sp.]|nr:AmmeMemoRadiSam system protein A [Candidatus ainarchaeum sp.]